MYKIKKYDEAIAEYQKAQKNTNNKDEKAASYYNEGNAHLQNGDGEKQLMLIRMLWNSIQIMKRF